MTGDIQTLVFDHITGLIIGAAQARELACEQALLSGDRGILETYEFLDDGTYKVEFEITDQVPYGEIHVKECD